MTLDNLPEWALDLLMYLSIGITCVGLIMVIIGASI